MRKIKPLRLLLVLFLAYQIIMLPLNIVKYNNDYDAWRELVKNEFKLN